MTWPETWERRPASHCGTPSNPETTAQAPTRPIGSESSGPHVLPDPHALDVDELIEMRSALLVALAHDPPRFGSLAWRELDEGDPRREAAAVVAGYLWWAAELGLSAPASPERLDALIREETARVIVEISRDLGRSMAYQRSYRAREHALARKVAPAIPYPPRCAA